MSSPGLASRPDAGSGDRPTGWRTFVLEALPRLRDHRAFRARPREHGLSWPAVRPAFSREERLKFSVRPGHFDALADCQSAIQPIANRRYPRK